MSVLSYLLQASALLIQVDAADFALAFPDDQWIVARDLRNGSQDCTETECEAAYTSGDFYILIRRHDQQFGLSAGYRGCRPDALRMSLDLTGVSHVGQGEQLGQMIEIASRQAARACNRDFIRPAHFSTRARFIRSED